MFDCNWTALYVYIANHVGCVVGRATFGDHDWRRIVPIESRRGQILCEIEKEMASWLAH